jgi:hypothetical protein
MHHRATGGKSQATNPLVYVSGFHVAESAKRDLLPALRRLLRISSPMAGEHAIAPPAGD